MAEPLSCYMVLKDFAGPAATLMAAGAAVWVTYQFGLRQAKSAEAQVEIANDRLKYDLWARRYEIYSSAKSLIELVVSANDFDKIDHMKVRDLYVKIDESRFFFLPSLQQYLEALHKLTEDFLTLGAQRKTLLNDEAKWSLSADELARYSAQLREIYAELPRKFESALAFERVIDIHY